MTCRKARIGDPRKNKNNRLNPSIVIRYNGHEDGRTRYVQIDAGKTYRESIDRWFLEHDIPQIDAFVITHDHADAMFGLDDARMVQKRGRSIPVYLSQQTFDVAKGALGYLIKSPPNYVGAGLNLEEAAQDFDHSRDPARPKTYTSSLSWNITCGPTLNEEDIQPFQVEGFQIIPFPVNHGGQYLSLGFMMGRGPRKFVYISDANGIPDVSLDLLRDPELEIELFVIDGLNLPSSVSHYHMEEALELIRKIRPRKALFTGITHGFDHDSTNRKLAKLKESEGLDVSLAYDGMIQPIPSL